MCFQVFTMLVIWLATEGVDTLDSQYHPMQAEGILRRRSRGKVNVEIDAKGAVLAAVMPQRSSMMRHIDVKLPVATSLNGSEIVSSMLENRLPAGLAQSSTAQMRNVQINHQPEHDRHSQKHTHRAGVEWTSHSMVLVLWVVAALTPFMVGLLAVHQGWFQQPLSADADNPNSAAASAGKLVERSGSWRGRSSWFAQDKRVSRSPSASRDKNENPSAGRLPRNNSRSPSPPFRNDGTSRGSQRQARLKSGRRSLDSTSLDVGAQLQAKLTSEGSTSLVVGAQSQAKLTGED